MQVRLRDMQAVAPPLLPILRSRFQAELLTLLLLSPEREWSLTELADRVGSSLATAGREVSRAEGAGIVKSWRRGNTRLVRANPTPLTAPMTDLLLRSFGPPQVLAEEMGSIAGIDSAYLFGSWAARHEGTPGPVPGDIDVLVLGNPDRTDVDDSGQRASRRLGREVSVTFRTPQWWAHGDDGFHTEVSSRPLVPVLGVDRRNPAT
jgi:predicted nucleotidyltransferase